MNYMTVLARLYINFVTGINLESSLALWVNFLSISLPFLGPCTLWFTALFGIVSSPSGLAWVYGIVQYHFLLLSLSLAHSLLILALDSSLSSSFFEKFHQLRYECLLWMGPSHRKTTKINLASFRLWLSCCATPSSSSSSSSLCVRAREQYHKKNQFMISFDFPWCLWAPFPAALRALGAPLSFIVY